ncbi:tubulin binding cofactor C-domain-containing protein [Podospora aff. communis PSN243]|uniref:Tubulin binding cofactor C-domain-containing protein n=1 Tax=Podospora aff. communis PSN243 TaxID=3040156 RepID=A0AAV9GGV9_9PEZI|nr:tubulin binding cofactor C-domain-containing protein [Podospora aff. communis PSN243]
MEDPKARLYRIFQEETENIREQISNLNSISTIGGERHDATEHILAGISNLSQAVADEADSLPAYDQRTYIEGIKALYEQLKEEQAKSGSKIRFQFKPRMVQTAISKEDSRHVFSTGGGNNENTAAATSSTAASEAQDSVGTLPTVGGKNYNEEISRMTGVRRPSFSTARDITLSDHWRKHILLPASASRATSSGRLTNIQESIVDMSEPTTRAVGAPFANLMLKDITASLIIAGHVDGSVHITGVRDSILVLVARQVRIHECENVDLYLHCSSHPIIEDCKGMRFAPAPARYLAESDKPEDNQWDQVDDFKWLKTEQSPNWSVMPEEDRVGVDFWKTTVRGLSTDSVLDILRKAGLDPSKARA